MNLLIRKLRDDDIDIYRLCYSNTEFKHYMWGYKPIDINESFDKLLNTEDNENFIVLCDKIDGESSDNIIGFCTFLLRSYSPISKKETYSFYGGVVPSLFNTGVGIYSCVSLLTLFFIKHPDATLYASTFSDNLRSVKMLTAVGFEKLEDTAYGKNHFVIDYEHYINTPFVVYLLSRINLSINLG